MHTVSKMHAYLHMFMYAYVGCRVTSFGTYVVRSKEYVSVLVAGES